MADKKISELTAYTPAVDVDLIPIVDTTTGITKHITWANIKATLKTYFDSLTTTLTNKTLTSPVLTTPQLNDTSADHQYITAVSELTADRTVTMPLLTGNDEFTFNAHTQTLTNKTLTSPKVNEDVALTATATQLNAQVLASNDGWISANETWAYASATTITVPSGAAAKYAKGDKIKLTQGTVKYFYIVGVADTVLTITAGSSYTLTSATISANYYSHASSPIGFPSVFAYTPVWIQATTNPTLDNGTLVGYFSLNGNICSFNLKLTIGSGTTVGTGEFILTTPITAANYQQGGISALIRDSGTSWFRATSFVAANTTQVNRIAGADNVTSCSQSIPMTWASGDSMILGGSYFI